MGSHHVNIWLWKMRAFCKNYKNRQESHMIIWKGHGGGFVIRAIAFIAPDTNGQNGLVIIAGNDDTG